MLPGTSHEPQLCTESQVIQSLEKPTTNGYQWTVQPSEAGDLYHLISSEAGDFGIHGKCAGNSAGHALPEGWWSSLQGALPAARSRGVKQPVDYGDIMGR